MGLFSFLKKIKTFLKISCFFINKFLTLVHALTNICLTNIIHVMKTTTFIKRFASVLLVMVLMLQNFAFAQVARPSDLTTKSKKSDKEQRIVKGNKMTPKMMKMQRPAKKQSSIASATDVKKVTPRKDTSRAPLAVTESGATLFGNLIYNYTWEDSYQLGFYSIDPNSGNYTAISTNEILYGAGTVVDGIAYISYADQDPFWGILYGLYTIVYDIETGYIIETIEHGTDDYTTYAINMTYNHAEDMIYATTYNEDASTLRLSTFDRSTYTYNMIADLPDDYDIYAMTFDPDGKLYFIFADGIVREIDPTTGAIIDEVANTGYAPAYLQSACWSPVDNAIIWAASNDYDSHLLAIDVATGTTETLCSYDNFEEWTCLYTTDPMASEGAPAAPVVNVTLDAPGALTGEIQVTAPSLTLSGSTLGNIDLIIELNGNEIYNQNVAPGYSTTMSGSFVEGNNTIRAYAVNNEGKGATATYKLYVGSDTPMPVTDLEVAIDDNGLATLTWTAPTEGANGGYLNTATLTYTIKRLDEVVATGVTNTTYADQLPDGMAAYQWAVYAVSDDKESEPALTERIIFGDAVTLPYEHAFDNDDCLDIYTIVDNNNDGKTWTYSSSNTALQYSYNSSNNADDYAFTPPLQLTNEKMLVVEVTSLCYSLQYPEKIEVTLGTSTDPATHTVIIPETVVDWNAPQTLRANFSVEDAGVYYVGIHAVSDADQFYLLVQDIRIAESAGFGAPKAVENVTATPGANGALTTTLSFTAPTESFGGEALTGNITVKAYRNDELIGETTLAPGADGTITDNNAAQGVNKYTLVTSNSEGEGDTYEISCFCGVDIPTEVTNIKFTTAEDNQSTVMSWEAPTTGAQGGYVNVEELVYTIYVPTSDGYYIEPIDETTELSYTITVEETALTGYAYYVSAKNAAGESDAYGGSVVLGKPYAIPFVEQITGTTLANGPWYIYSGSDDSYAEWGLGASIENYNLPEIVTAPDGGMFVCYDSWEYAGGSCGLKAPKISLSGATAPTLYFSMYHYSTAADDNELTISVSTDDNTYDEIFAKKVNDTDNYGWVEYQVSLDEYKDVSWIAMMIDANISANGFVFVDYVIVENASENDVMVKSVNVPSNVAIGEEAEITASILNKGTNPASYIVDFYVEDEVIASEAGSDLENNEVMEYTAKFTPKAENIGFVNVRVVVTMTSATDEVEANNEATAKLNVKQPELPVVIDLSGTKNNSIVTLTWSTPIVTADPIVDDMEKYESFAYDNIGDYTIIDADQAETYSINNYELPNAYIPKAWQVWAPSEVGITSELWLPYSGDKCLVAWSTITGSGPANDWLISPEILGGTDISFYAGIPTTQYGAETFEILYSTTGTDISSFQLLEQGSKGTEGWEQFTYSLPIDAKHFAIRYTSTDIFALLIDDLAYVPASRRSDLEIEGYNVYVNGAKVNDAIVTETTYDYDATGAAATTSFNVTVVYNEGESLFSNTVVLDNVGIKDLNSIGVNIYGQDDYIKIENVAGRMVRVFTVDGRIVYSAKATDNDVLIPANLGVYIVNIDNAASCKVFVR